jgi:predicted nucleic acid-binding protein
MATLPTWIDVRHPQIGPSATLSHLGPGECDAILLAVEIQADILLLDDQQGRQAAQQQGLTIMGTLGVLEQAASHRLLDLPTVLTQLQATNFRIHPAIIQTLLARATTYKTIQSSTRKP